MVKKALRIGDLSDDFKQIAGLNIKRVWVRDLQKLVSTHSVLELKRKLIQNASLVMHQIKNFLSFFFFFFKIMVKYALEL